MRILVIKHFKKPTFSIGENLHFEIDFLYSHIIDEDRKVNAQRFEEAFYSGKKVSEYNEPAEASEPPAEETVKEPDDTQMLLELLKNPEVVGLLRSLINKK